MAEVIHGHGPQAASHGTAGRPATEAQAAAGGKPAMRRQFISFAFYKLMAEFRRLPQEQQRAMLGDLVGLIGKNDTSKMLLLTYSCVGTRPDVDFMLWKISYEVEHLQNLSAAMNRLPIGGYLLSPYSYLAQSKRSTYVDKIDPSHDDIRTNLVPGGGGGGKCHCL